MGVKSTRTLSRAEAEALYVRLRMNEPDIERQFRAEAASMDNQELENKLEEIHDRQAGGESFNNYLIG